MYYVRYDIEHIDIYIDLYVIRYKHVLHMAAISAFHCLSPHLPVDEPPLEAEETTLEPEAAPPELPEARRVKLSTVESCDEREGPSASRFSILHCKKKKKVQLFSFLWEAEFP